MLLELSYIAACFLLTYFLFLKPKSIVFLSALGIFCFVLFGIYGAAGFAIAIGAKLVL
ncbi:hypothetical protein HY993_04540 [Candidatus Micrarchaeota archaeon]|nr:hypothetical protein [Candidatus Micrarchaeota archaeon]